MEKFPLLMQAAEVRQWWIDNLGSSEIRTTVLLTHSYFDRDRQKVSSSLHFKKLVNVLDNTEVIQTAEN